MLRGIAVKTTILMLIGMLWIGAAAHAQEPPPTPPPTPPVTPPPTSPVTPPPTPPVTQPATPPVTQPTTPPVTQSQPQTPPAVPETVAAPAAPARVSLTDAELRSRRDAMFMMEAALSRAVDLAAASTQREIEALDPRIRATLFSPVRPTAYATYLEDYGVFFHVQIPTYVPSVVSIVRELAETARPTIDPAQPAALAAPRRGNAPFDPDAIYVDAVRRYLIDAMLKTGRSLDLRPHEWLTVAARGEDVGEPGGPSMMVVRVKASDLNDFLAGRLTADEVAKRVQVTGYSSRR